MTLDDFLIACLLFANFFSAEMNLNNEVGFDRELPPPMFTGPMSPALKGQTRIKRPFYIIGHMVNSKEEVDKFLRKGSNALEVDIEFADNGTVLGTYHGLPCDCFRGCFKREPIGEFLDHVRNRTSMPHSKYRGRMSLLFLDLKTTKIPKKAKAVAGVTLALNLVNHLWKGGFDVGMNDPLKSIARMYDKLGIKGHRWQGDGLSNCLRFLMPVDRLKAAVKLRDSEDGYVDKVYHWTIDLPYYIEKSVRLGVDGIITNQPHNVLGVVTSIFFQDRLRVASVNDSPWERVRRSPSEVIEDEEDMDTNIIGGEETGAGE
ncbi:dermonecrotic toxin SPH-like isoform X2 [Dermacentor andersoni]|uniref:dermonecrotic toxin SPH-like isoform X2 n=1 Tax=Dermacentor andersoni TaxID=34620 RepID=UPI002416B912|nr:dermonecrotic toxin SPH-like isoform X2 [Dermacentor andersoni]